MSDTQKQAILDRHNLYRSRVALGQTSQPAGADIVLMVSELLYGAH
jgi:hypothetical protein